MTQNEIEELSRSLDELNSGHPPASGDAETAGLLEIAALLKRADLPVSPPPHILTAAVQSAADGIRAARSRRNKWMYSGLLGAAASLLIFLGLNSLPNWQTSATVPPRSPAPQQAQTISPPADSASAASQKKSASCRRSTRSLSGDKFDCCSSGRARFFSARKKPAYCFGSVFSDRTEAIRFAETSR